MSQQRLIDANAAKKNLFSYYSFVNENTIKANYTGETLMSYEVADMIEDCIDNAPTIDPETLPIVRELREKLERVTVEQDAAVMDVKTLVFGKIKACSYCRHNDPENFNCPMDKNLRYCDSWEWCGPKKEAANE